MMANSDALRRESRVYLAAAGITGLVSAIYISSSNMSPIIANTWITVAIANLTISTALFRVAKYLDGQLSDEKTNRKMDDNDS
jgi:hypothetical protein